MNRIASRLSLLRPAFTLFLSLFLSTLQAAQQDDIVFGMSTALTGPAADLGQGMRAGFEAGIKRINRNGGIQGRRLKLIALDDGYEPVRTAPNMRQLILEEKVLAVVGNVGTPTAVAAIPIANRENTLLFAPFTGAGVLRKSPPDRYVINFRASYAEETAAMVDALVNIGGLKPEEIAFFTQRDSYGDAGFSGGMSALAKHGLNDASRILHARYERNTLAVEDAAANTVLAAQPPRAIIMVGAYAPCAKFIRLIREAELDPIFLNVSFVGSSSLARELKGVTAKAIVTQVTPFPENSSIPVVRKYLEDMKLLDSWNDPSFVSLEGYIASQILGRALGKISGEIDRESIIDALEMLGAFDIGLGIPLNLDRISHQASHSIWPTLLDGNRFRPFDWNKIQQLQP